MKAMVEPLPLVPATWITGGSRRCGWPSAPRMLHIRSSERSISFGCSAVSRATMESMEDMNLAGPSPERQFPLYRSKDTELCAQRLCGAPDGRAARAMRQDCAGNHSVIGTGKVSAGAFG